jgi:hypothetical protein
MLLLQSLTSPRPAADVPDRRPIGFAFVTIKVGLREVPPFALAMLRFFFAAVPLVFFVKRPQMPCAS